MKGASSIVRLTRVSASGLDELKRAVLDDLDALSPGLTAVASALPIPGGGAIDLLASDGRGRLTLVSLVLEADHDSVGRAVAQWDWLTANLAALRALMQGGGMDLAIEPRLLVVAGRTLEGARRLAGFIARPEVELFEAVLVDADGRRGVLFERAGRIAAPPAGGTASVDPLLAGLSAGAPRSLVRRVLEQMRDMDSGAGRFEPVPIEGGVDLWVEGRPIGSLVVTPSGMQVRVAGPAPALSVEDDEGCRQAVALLSRAARGEVPASPDRPSGPEAPRDIAATLTCEEIAEFEKVAGPVSGRRADRPDEADAPAAAAPGPSLSGVSRTGFVEN